MTEFEKEDIKKTQAQLMEISRLLVLFANEWEEQEEGNSQKLAFSAMLMVGMQGVIANGASDVVIQNLLDRGVEAGNKALRIIEAAEAELNLRSGKENVKQH
jgi:hypothetical protein